MRKSPLWLSVLNNQKSPRNLSSLYNSWKDGKVKFDPAYQRNYIKRNAAWNTKLIESQLVGISLGEIIIVEKTSPDGLDVVDWVVDGQHRVETLMRFMDGEIKLNAKHQVFTDESLANKKFKDLLSIVQKQFRNTDISVYSFEEDGDFSAKEIFLIMNEGSKSLSKMDRFHAEVGEEEHYKAILNFADKDWCKYIGKTDILKRNHIRHLLQHMMDYNYYNAIKPYNKDGIELAFYHLEVMSKWTKNQLKTELGKVAQFVYLYDLLSGQGDKLTDSKSARHSIFTNIVLRTMIDKHGYSSVCSKVREIRVFWDDWFIKNETVFLDNALDTRRMYVLPTTFNPIIKQFIEDLGKHIGLPILLPTVTQAQRKKIIKEDIDENGKVTDSITGSKMNPDQLDVGHIVARKDGGDTNPSNLILQSKPGNRSGMV